MTMRPEYKPFVDDLIELCIREDIGDGDHTSLACIPADEHGRMRLLCKQEGVIAGIEIAQLVLNRLDPEMRFEQVLRDGDRVKPGDVAMVVTGRVQSLLQTERLMLNIMQRMSGIATMTHKYVERLEGTRTRVLDTRKTTPGMRMLEKAAVKIGGGMNHRIGLFDMILLKDNHVDFAGGIANAISRCHAYLKEKGKDMKGEQKLFYQSIVERIENNVQVLADLREEHTQLRAKLGDVVKEKQSKDTRCDLAADIKHTAHEVSLLKMQIDRIKSDREE